MKQKVKRTPKNMANISQGDVTANTYNPRAGAQKTLTVGPQLMTPNGATQVIGQDMSAAAVKVLPGTALALYNNAGAVAWVAMNKAADAALTAPTGFTNAIPLKPNDWTYLNMGENDQMRTSAATVGVYIIEDDTSFQVIPEDQAF